MSAYKYVIIGGGIAAGRAAENVRKVDAQGSIALVAGEPHPPYQRPPLSKGYLLGKEGLDHVYLKPLEAYAQEGVDVLLGVRAVRLEPTAHRVTLANGRELTYERLLLATGSVARRLELPGSTLPNVFTLRTIADADAIRAAVRPGMRVVVVGGSFIGTEVAAALAQLGAQVTVVFPESRLLERVVPEALSERLHREYTARGVRVQAGVRPARFEGERQVTRVVLESGETLAAELVVMGVGVSLETELARQAGLALDAQGAVVVDEFLRTSDPTIYAAGDIASWPDNTFGRRLCVEHWDVARAQGLRAGRNMAGEQKPYTTLPYFFSDLFDLSLEVWGDLTAWEQTVVRGDPDGPSFAYYYFADERLTAVLAVGRPESERKPMQALVRARPALTDLARPLADESVDLATLAARFST